MAVGKLYMTDLSPPVRSVLLTEQALGLRLTHGEMSLLNGDNRKPAYLKLNPQHTVPMFLDQDGSKIIDSHAIMAYLVDKYGKDDSLYPKKLDLRAKVNERLHFDSSIFSILRRIIGGFRKNGYAPINDAIIEEVITNYDFLNKFLDEHQYVAGDNLTIADFSVFTSVASLNYLIPIDDAKFPNVVNWLKRIEELPYINVHAEGFNKLKGLIEAMKAKSNK